MLQTGEVSGVYVNAREDSAGDADADIIETGQGTDTVDAAAKGGMAVNKVTVAGLKKLSQSGQLDPEPQRWVDAAISLLESDDPKNPPGDAKQLIIDGCAKNGYPLKNLT